MTMTASSLRSRAHDGGVADDTDPAPRPKRRSFDAGYRRQILAEYEALRAGLGGVGVAKLVGTQCGGCHLGLSAVEVARIRKVGQNEITHCEECGRLLVP